MNHSGKTDLNPVLIQGCTWIVVFLIMQHLLYYVITSLYVM